MFFTIAIPTFNRKEILEISLEKIFDSIKNIEDKIEVLVVDDCSKDETKSLLEKYKKNYPTIFNYIISEKNNGISKTRNILVKNAKGSHLIFIDSDVFVTPKTIETHIRMQKENKNIIVQGNLKFISNLDELNEIKKNLFTDYSNSFFDTANLSIEKSKIIEAGFFDENFTGYGWEDLELGIRIRKLNLKLKKNKDTLAYHYHPEKIIDLDFLIEKEKQRAIGSIYFLKKHPSFEVKMITQNHPLHYFLDYLLTCFFRLESKGFVKKLKEIEFKTSKKFTFILRMYLNHLLIKEIRLLDKTNS